MKLFFRCWRLICKYIFLFWKYSIAPYFELISFIVFWFVIMYWWNSAHLTAKIPLHDLSINGPLEFVTNHAKFLIDETKVCENNTFLLITIHSAVRNLEKRNIIRNTWGNFPTLLDLKIRRVFFLGLPVNSSWQTGLSEESKLYHDIVQGNFIDVYENLTTKHLLLYKWIDKTCKQNINFILKTDDDVVINIFKLMRRLINFVIPQERLLMCYVMKNPVVFREGKYSLSYERYHASAYPDFCSGTVYLISPDVPGLLLKSSFSVPVEYNFIDDAYMTGIVRMRAGLSFIRTRYQFSSNAYTMFDSKPWLKFEEYEKNSQLLFGILQWVDNQTDIMVRIWNLILKYENPQ